jgi:hypothetical protein
MSIPMIGAFAVLQLTHHGRHISIVILRHANYTHRTIRCITSGSGIHKQVADLVDLDRLVVIEREVSVWADSLFYDLYFFLLEFEF